MIPLLDAIFNAHGGLERWRRYSKIEIDAVTTGGLFPLKGLLTDTSTRRMTVWLREEHASVRPFGAPDQRTDFTPRRLAIEKLDGRVVAEATFPRSIFIGHGLSTAWQPMHRAYFNGYAMWTYLTTPFLLQMEGVEVEEIEPWREGMETWHVLHAFFPGTLATHSPVQTFYFGEDLLLRRHDYNVDVAGGFAAAQLTSQYVVADGISLPTRRRAYAMGPDRQPIDELLMVAIDLSNPTFS